MDSRAGESLYRDFFEKSKAVMLLIELETGAIVDANPAAAAFYGWSLERLRGMNISEINLLSPELIREERTRAAREQRDYFEFRHRRADGSLRDVKVYSSPIEIDGRLHLHSIVHDVTELKAAEERSLRLLRERGIILDTAPLGIKMTQRRRMVWVNSEMPRLFGYKREEMEGRPTRMLYPDEASHDKLGEDAYPLLAEGKTYDILLELLRKDGERRWFRYIGQAVEPADLDKGVIWILEDVTERKLDQDRIRDLLAEKELVLREVQHRVKNNLALVQSLLSLNAERLAEGAAREVFLDAEGQLRSMGALYDKLYRSGSLGSASARDYLGDLLRDIVAVAAPGGRLGLSLELEDFPLGERSLLPLGIILNELVVNSMKYAFRGVDRPGIRVELHREGGVFRLSYQDNGVGLPEKSRPSPTGGFGMELIRILVAQIGGRLSVGAGPGARFLIEGPTAGPSRGARGEDGGGAS